MFKNKIKHLIKNNPFLYEICFHTYSWIMKLFCAVSPVNNNRILFCSLSGRNFDDSPKAIYDEILNRHEFDDWELYWAFKNPENFSIPRGEVIKFGGLSYWKTLFSSKVWIGNGGIDNGLDLSPFNRVVVNTWHGSVLKKSEGEENSDAVLKHYRSNKKMDNRTIRCIQNDFDLKTYTRLFRASSDCFLKSGLPRNDILLKYSDEDKRRIKEQLGIEDHKKIILYMPTYREYLINDSFQTYIAPPISFEKWEKELSGDYVFFIRAHYAVVSALNIQENTFLRDVSKYEPLSELYLIADLLITDYSSCFYDYSILEKPVLCFAYDREEYEAKRGLYLTLEDVMPCGIFYNENELIDKIKTIDYDAEHKRMIEFKKKWLKYYGNASKDVVDAILSKMGNNIAS